MSMDFPVIDLLLSLNWRDLRFTRDNTDICM